MSNLENFVQYYYQQIQQDVNSLQVFQTSVSEFQKNFNHYVLNNLSGLTLTTHSYQTDKENNLIYLPSSVINEFLTLQPVLHMTDDNKIYSLNFLTTIDLKNGFNSTDFCYLTPNDFDKNYQLFSYMIYLFNSYLDVNTINKFFEMIHTLNNVLASIISKQDNNSSSNAKQIEDNTIEEVEYEADKQLFFDFVSKYKEERNRLYEAELLQKMENDKELVFLNFSRFLSDNFIHKNFKISKLLETLENYTPIYEAVHLDKEIYLSAHYYPNFTIRPIIEYSYLKEQMENEAMITVDFIKFEVSFFHNDKKDDKFSTTLTLIPYKKDADFENFLDLYILLKLDKLSLFSVDDNTLMTIDILPFLDSLCDELLNVLKMMKNPTIKRQKEANFLNDNRDFNERDLDRYIKEK